MMKKRYLQISAKKKHREQSCTSFMSGGCPGSRMRQMKRETTEAPTEQ